jgi:hypothetical protein
MTLGAQVAALRNRLQIPEQQLERDSTAWKSWTDWNAQRFLRRIHWHAGKPSISFGAYAEFSS